MCTCKPTAPFKQYKITDAQAYADGVKAGLTWRDHWNHRPGGPWVPNEGYNPCADWSEHVVTLRRHNKLWLEGWEEGNNARLANKAAANKLVCLLPA